MLVDGVAAAIGAAIELGLFAEVGGVGGSCCAQIAVGNTSTTEATPSSHAAGANFRSPPTRAGIRSRLMV